MIDGLFNKAHNSKTQSKSKANKSSKNTTKSLANIPKMKNLSKTRKKSKNSTSNLKNCALEVTETNELPVEYQNNISPSHQSAELESKTKEDKKNTDITK